MSGGLPNQGIIRSGEIISTGDQAVGEQPAATQRIGQSAASLQSWSKTPEPKESALPNSEPNTGVNHGTTQTMATGPDAVAAGRTATLGLAPGQRQTRQPAQAPPEPKPKVKVLFLAANPWDTTSLELDAEIREITEKVRAGGSGEHFEIISRWATSADDLLRHLGEHRPQIVHFTGHGARDGRIVVEDAGTRSVPVPQHAVTRVFRAFSKSIRVVLLNTCFSLPQARAITEVIDCATGTPARIDDTAATAFAASFYRAIGFGHSISEAFEQGCLSLDLQSIPEPLRPRLVTRAGTDPSSVVLVERKQL